MRLEIKSYLNNNVKMKRTKKIQINNFIDNFANFENLRNDSDIGVFSLQDDESVYRSIEFVKNCIYEMSKVYPNIVINECDYKKIHVPKYWKLSKRHEAIIGKMIQESYKSLSKFYKDDGLTELLNNVQNNIKNINLLIREIVCFSTIVKDKGAMQYSLFNKKSVTYIIEFCLLSIIREHIVLIDQTIVKIVKPVGEDADDLVLDELEIVKGEKTKLSSQVGEYLIAIITNFIDTKKEINYSYQDIKDLVNRAKEKEKDIITQKLKDLTDEERNINTEFKKHKLGDWGKGLQKGLTQYVAEFYDNECEENDALELKDKQLDNLGLVDDTERSFARMDLDEQLAVDARIEAEEFDISALPEDDDHGDNDDIQYGY